MIEELPLGDPYPMARNAVAFHETHPGGEFFWSLARESDWSLETVIYAIAQTFACCPVHAVYKDEVKTDDFRRYVAAKLGMM